MVEELMKKIIIIGGGIAGITSGIFAQKNDFESTILEKNHILGGQCTGWDRQGYHIDGCIHWLVGTKKNTPMYNLWETVGALGDNIEIYHPETFLSYDHNGTMIHFYRDIEQLKKSWINISPDDKDIIEEFCKDTKKLDSFEIPVEKPMDFMSLPEKIKVLLSMKDAGIILKKYGKINFKEFSCRFKHPALQQAFYTFAEDNFSIALLFFGLATFTKNESSIPQGGSRAMACRMVEKYKKLGGNVESNCEIVEVCIKGKKIVDLTDSKGKKYYADYFIAACDPNVVFEKLLKNRYNDKQFEKRYNNPADYLVASNMYVSLGYKGKIENLPRTVRFPITPFKIHNTTIETLTITHYSYEKNFAPQGHEVITCAINLYNDYYEYWKKLSKDKKSYEKEKNEIGNQVKSAIEHKYSCMKGKLEVLDVVSPITYERYCNAYKGSFMAFFNTINAKQMDHTGKIKGLNNIFLTGQWLQPPGGLPTAAIKGKHTIMRICKREKKQFYI